MKLAAMTYRVNVPSVVHQTIDGETVVINLARGFYYSLEGSGAEVWSGITQGMGDAEIVGFVRETYEGEADLLEAGVRGLLDELRAEDLIVRDETDASQGPRPGADAPQASARRPFAPPLLRKYSDLHDLLLLDPVHRVDEAGWPERAPERPPAAP
jgi:hypothetical protein